MRSGKPVYIWCCTLFDQFGETSIPVRQMMQGIKCTPKSHFTLLIGCQGDRGIPTNVFGNVFKSHPKICAVAKERNFARVQIDDRSDTVVFAPLFTIVVLYFYRISGRLFSRYKKRENLRRVVQLHAIFSSDSHRTHRNEHHRQPQCLPPDQRHNVWKQSRSE